jgi:hypothetical protein
LDHDLLIKICDVEKGMKVGEARMRTSIFIFSAILLLSGWLPGSLENEIHAACTIREFLDEPPDGGDLNSCPGECPELETESCAPRYANMPLLSVLADDYYYQETGSLKRINPTIALSILLPGTGHFYLGTPGAIVAGSIHLILDGVILIGTYMSGTEGLKRAANWVFCGLLMSLNRLISACEAYVWCRSINKARSRAGSRRWRPRFSFCYLPDQDAYGGDFPVVFSRDAISRYP